MAVHPSRSCGNQGPITLSPDFCGIGTDMNPLRQGKPNSEAKRDAIPPLRGADIRGSGDHRPHTQHHGKPRF